MARECDGTCDTCETECYVSNAGYDNPDSEPRGAAAMARDEVRNARIVETFLGVEDHGLFIAQIEMDYGGSRQGFQRILTYGGDNGVTVLRQILETVGVDNWEALRGKHCRVRIHGGFIRHIGNIIKDQWTRWPEDTEDAAEPAEQEGGGDGA